MKTGLRQPYSTLGEPERLSISSRELFWGIFGQFLIKGLSRGALLGAGYGVFFFIIGALYGTFYGLVMGLALGIVNALVIGLVATSFFHPPVDKTRCCLILGMTSFVVTLVAGWPGFHFLVVGTLSVILPGGVQPGASLHNMLDDRLFAGAPAMIAAFAACHAGWQVAEWYEDQT